MGVPESPLGGASVVRGTKLHFLHENIKGILATKGVRRENLVLEVAVESEADYLVTHNIKDFAGAERFSVKVTTPRGFLEIIGQVK